MSEFEKNRALNMCHELRLTIINPSEKDLIAAWIKTSPEEIFVSVMYTCTFPDGFDRHVIKTYIPLLKGTEPPDSIKYPHHSGSDRVVSITLSPLFSNDPDTTLLYPEHKTDQAEL